MAQARNAYVFAAPDIQALVQQLNFVMASIADRLDKMEGIRGTPAIGTNSIEYASGTFDFAGTGSMASQSASSVAITGGVITISSANGTVTLDSAGITIADANGTTIHQLGFS